MLSDQMVTLEVNKKNLESSIRQFFRASKFEDLEFYKMDIILRIEYLFKIKFSQITGYSVNELIKDEIKQKKQERTGNIC